MSDVQAVWLCVLIGLIGLAVSGGIVWLGFSLFRKEAPEVCFNPRFWHALFGDWRQLGDFPGDIPQQLCEGYSEYLQRRNEFWTSYGQVLIAVLIVTVLAILLIAKSISAEAGLPILSGISGFAIAKGVSGSKTVRFPREHERRQG